MNQLQFLQSLIGAGCIKVGPLTKLKDGSDSPIYVDLRDKLWAHPPLLWELGSLFYNRITALADAMGTTGRIVICGIPEAANPLATATVLLADQNMAENFVLIALRHSPKEYGAGGKSFVIGAYQPGDQVFLIDDVITSAQSKRDAINKLEVSGFPKEAITIVVAFDRQQGGLESLEQEGYRVASVFKILEVAALLHEHGQITDTDLAAVKEFIATHRHDTWACPSCKTVNPTTATICSQCNTAKQMA